MISNFGNTIVSSCPRNLTSSTPNSAEADTNGGRGIDFREGSYNRFLIATTGGANGDLQFHRSTDGSSYESTPIMSLNKANGYVGIGTNNPDGSKLRVDGDVGISGRLSVTDDIYIYDGAGGDLIFRVVDSADDGLVQVYANDGLTAQIGGNPAVDPAGAEASAQTNTGA